MDTILGMSLEAFTLIHVLISLAGIASGIVVLFGLLAGKRLPGWTAWFLATTVAGAQAIVLAAFVVLTVLAARRFREEAARL